VNKKIMYQGYCCGHDCSSHSSIIRTGKNDGKRMSAGCDVGCGWDVQEVEVEEK